MVSGFGAAAPYAYVRQINRAGLDGQCQVEDLADCESARLRRDRERH